MTTTRSTAAIAALFSVTGLARGQQDIFWNEPDGGVWSDAANWSPAVVPNNNANQLFNATLDLQVTPYSVGLDINVTLENFSLLWGGASLDLRAQSFDINGDLRLVDGAIIRSIPSVNETRVGGLLLLSDSALMNAGRINSDGNIVLGGDEEVDICDSDVNHRGAGGIAWNGTGGLFIGQGGSLSNGAGSTFSIAPGANRTVTGDGTGRLVNQGTLVNAAPGRGVTGLTNISGVEFINTGTVTVAGGGLTLNTANDLTPEGELSGGVWNILNGSFLDFVNSPVTTLSAEVNIAGSDSRFFGIEGLSEITDEGRFSISDGKVFQTQARLFNDGVIEVGLRSTFDAAGFSLGNFDGSGLFGGTFIVEGEFLTGSDAITFLGSDLTLIGQGSTFTGIEALEGVGGRFALEGGRGFQTIGDLSVGQGGTVRVGSGSTLEVSGRLTNNNADGVFEGGTFEVLGTLSAQDLNIVQIANELTLNGQGSQLLNSRGENALAQLNRITEEGVLRLRDGRSLDVIDNFTVEGELSISGALGVGRVLAPGTVTVAGSLLFTSTSLLEIVINGSDPALYGKIFADQAEVEQGAVLAFVVNPDAGLVFGDELFLLSAGSITGEFTTVLGLDIGNGLFFEVFQDASGITARVVPAPGAGVALLGVGLMAASRRRRV